MSEYLRPYPAYVNSGLPWLGDIPTHWEVRRNGRMFAQRNQVGFPDRPILEVSLRTGVRARDFGNSKRKQVMSDREKYKLAVKGDLAYNMMRMWQGAVGVASMDGLISPAYVVARPYSEADSRYYAYLFRTSAYMNEVDKYSHGIVKDRNRLYWDKFKQMPSAFPTPDEQTIIANFLDHNRVLVQRFIHNKQQVIKLLQEQKQAIINRAVTRGLNPDVRLKLSAIDWRGDVPEHWEVRRLRTIATVKASGVDKNIVEGERAVLLCNYVDVYKNEVITDQIDFMKGTTTPDEMRAFELKAGDVIITKDSESWDDIAVPAFVPDPLPGVVCAYHLALVRPHTQLVVSEFLFRAFCADPIMDQFRVSAKGVTRYGLAQGAIKNAFFPLPKKEEQKRIADFIEEKSSEIAAAINRAEREITLINEYRTRLITDVITGKVDVRDIPVEPIKEPEYIEEMAEHDEANDQEILQRRIP